MGRVGGMISGIGSGLAIRYGGAMDGIEVMAVIFAKPIGISVGTFVMIYLEQTTKNKRLFAVFYFRMKTKSGLASGFSFLSTLL